MSGHVAYKTIFIRSTLNCDAKGGFLVVLDGNVVRRSAMSRKCLVVNAKQPKMAAAIAGVHASQGSQIFRL